MEAWKNSHYYLGVVREGSLSKPRIVHRLDAATGGLLVVAKTKQSEIKLKDHFANRVCKKRYRAIVFGRLKSNGENINDDGDDAKEKDDTNYCGSIDFPVGGRPALTKYSIVSHSRSNHPKANGWITTVDLFPVTGRKHQLRRHLQCIGHPIWGDLRYGPYLKEECQEEPLLGTDSAEDTIHANKYPHYHLCLWALEITFSHPCKEGVDVTACIDEPLWYSELRSGQDDQWKKDN